MKKTVAILMSILFVFFTVNLVLAYEQTADGLCTGTTDPATGACFIDTEGSVANEDWTGTFTDLPDIDFTTATTFNLELEGYVNLGGTGATYPYDDPIDPFVDFGNGWVPLVPDVEPGVQGDTFPMTFDLSGAADLFNDDLVDGDFDLAWGCHFYLESVKLTIDYPQSVPEPNTMFLLGTGLVVLAGFGRRKKFFK